MHITVEMTNNYVEISNDYMNGIQKYTWDHVMTDHELDAVLSDITDKVKRWGGTLCLEQS